MKIKSLATLIALAIATPTFAGSLQQTGEVKKVTINLRELETNRTIQYINPISSLMQDAVLTKRDVHAVEELLKCGVDPNAPIGCGDYSPLDGAVGTSNLEMLKFLLAWGARPKGRELWWAAFSSNHTNAVAMASALLVAGADPNATNYYGAPLVAAARSGNRNLVALLLCQPGIEVNIKDRDGATALINARTSEIVEMLLDAGADPYVKDQRGHSVADRFTFCGLAARTAYIAAVIPPAK